MRTPLSFLIAVLFITTWTSGCNKMETYQTEPIQDYFPLETGKFIIYKLDSTVFTDFGTVTEVHSYQEKMLIDAAITDAAGRPSYRAYRFIRDAEGRTPWRSLGTLLITPLADQIEVVDDNLRVIKMHLPIKEGFTWKGNRYLNNNPYGSISSFQNDDYMNTWEFFYENLNDTFTYNQQRLSNVVKIVQIDERFALDTVTVTGNQATIPKNTKSVWLRGNATDNITINANPPEPGKENLIIYNQTNQVATLNGIAIPSKQALYFRYYDNQWFYPNPLYVASNKVTFPSNQSTAFIFGNATDKITVDVSKIDTFDIRNFSIYNKSNADAYPNFKGTLSTFSIPAGTGRRYELHQGEWRFYDGINTTLRNDPYITELPFGNTNYSVEKYAKGIGLVFQETLMWEYQPEKGGFKNGFGVKRTMIDHN